MPYAEEWIVNLRAAFHEYGRPRGVGGTPVVKIVLSDGETFFVSRMTPVGDDYVALDAFPEVPPGQAMRDALMAGEDSELRTPRTVIVHPTQVLRVELLPEAPGGAAFGFAAAEE